MGKHVDILPGQGDKHKEGDRAGQHAMLDMEGIYWQVEDDRLPCPPPHLVLVTAAASFTSCR